MPRRINPDQIEVVAAPKEGDSRPLKKAEIFQRSWVYVSNGSPLVMPIFFVIGILILPLLLFLAMIAMAFLILRSIVRMLFQN